jgi:GLPGLI family protein
VYIQGGYAQISLAPNYEDLNKFTVLDSAYIKCAYQLTYLRDSLKTNSSLTDSQMLLLGKNVSKYYSQKKLDHNKWVAEELKRSPDGYTNFPDGVWSCELFKNNPQGKVTICDIGSVLHGNFVYEEALPVWDWKITNENQTILSYNCRKATTSFRGRDYIAWFTPDIPVPNGPWLFGGLPGLILKLYDTQNNFVFECTGIENRSDRKETINYYLVEYTQLPRNDYRKIEKRYHDDWIKYEQLYGVPMIILVDPVTKKESRPTSLKLPYNPIELE